MDLPAVWLRGNIADVPATLQPVAHALVQSGQEVEKLMIKFPPDNVWLRPAGVASVGFHLQHLAGVLDRLFTYARGESLTHQQLKALQSETAATSEFTTPEMVQRSQHQIGNYSYLFFNHLKALKTLSKYSTFNFRFGKAV